jgi:hypothetical protein
LEKYDG